MPDAVPPRVRRRRRERAAAGLLGLLVVALSACTAAAHGYTGRELTNPWPVPEVSLTATDGSSYSLKDDAEDQLTLVFFGYTHCPDVCPLVMNNLAASMNRLDDTDLARTGMVFVTTDPARDDPASLRRYLDDYDTSFEGLSGDLGDIIDLGDPLHVYVSEGKELPTGGYDLAAHSTFVLGIEDDEAVMLWNEQTSATEFAADIHALLEKD